jgi:YVTN family beta-propeller protein
MSQNHSLQPTRLWLAALLGAALLAGCGNEFRPVAIPIIPPGGTPQLRKHVVVIGDSSNAGSPTGGVSTNIDVAGDSVFAVRPVGPNPVHAALAANQARTVIANSDDTLSTFVTFDVTPAAPITITLPAGSAPRFVHTRDPNNAYVALHGSGFDPACGTNGAVAFVSMTSLTVSAIVCVGVGPVALAELPNGSKLYVANEGSGDVTVINTADRSIVATILVGNTPSSIDVSADGAFVYVANKGSNSVSAINATTDAVTPITTGIGVGPNFLRFDPSRKRVYVTNDAGSLSIIEADPDPAQAAAFHTAIDVPVGSSPVSVTALADKTKVYVANFGSNSVSVIDAATKTVTKTVDVGLEPVSIDSSPDSAQVFVANTGLAGTSGNVSVIRTSDDTKFIDVPLPPPSVAPAGTIVNPKFLFVTP